MEHVDYLVVGAGLFGAVFAHEAKKAGKSVMVIDRRPQVAGNVYTEEVEGINVHKYGAHIFHTNSSGVQPLYQFSRGQLPRGTVFPSVQHVYLQ